MAPGILGNVGKWHTETAHGKVHQHAKYNLACSCTRVLACTGPLRAQDFSSFHSNPV